MAVDPADLLDSRVHCDEDGSLIDFAMRNLSETEFRILMLCELDGFKRREVARMLGMPLSTVTWHYRQALKLLKNLLEKEIIG